MKELIKVTENEAGKQVVSARELYAFLELSPAHWAKWSKRNIVENKFALEGDDWVGFTQRVSGNIITDFVITIDFSKRLSMMAKTDKGEDARRYFIECEKIAKSAHQTTQIVKLSAEELFLQSAQIMLDQKRQLESVKEDVKQLTETVANLQVVNSEIQYFTIMGHCRNIHKQISLEQAKVYGVKCRAMCNQLGFSMGKVPDPRFGTVNTYPLDVLKEIIK